MNGSNARPMIPLANGSRTAPQPTSSSHVTEHEPLDPDVREPEYINFLLGKARSLRASDLHVRHTDIPSVRIDGKMQQMPGVRRGPMPEAIVKFCKKHMSDEKFNHLLGEMGMGEGRFTSDASGPVRVHAFRATHGIELPLRLLAPTVPLLTELGLPAIVRDFPNYRNGLVLITGETGSGKSTTLAAVINEMLNLYDGNILTFEDPIEYMHEQNNSDGSPRRSRITQCEIGRDIGSYSAALKSALRSDADTIMVGEMRDPETIRATLQLAETGNLVFSTGHDQRATKTVERLISAFPPSESMRIKSQICNVVRAIVSLRLLPKAQGKGRVPVAEVLYMNAGIRELLLSDQNRIPELPNALKQNARDNKTQTLEMALAKAHVDGLITMATARGETENEKELMSEIEGLRKLINGSAR